MPTQGAANVCVYIHTHTRIMHYINWKKKPLLTTANRQLPKCLLVATCSQNMKRTQLETCMCCIRLTVLLISTYLHTFNICCNYWIDAGSISLHTHFAMSMHIFSTYSHSTNFLWFQIPLSPATYVHHGDPHLMAFRGSLRPNSRYQPRFHWLASLGQHTRRSISTTTAIPHFHIMYICCIDMHCHICENIQTPNGNLQNSTSYSSWSIDSNKILLIHFYLCLDSVYMNLRFVSRNARRYYLLQKENLLEEDELRLSSARRGRRSSSEENTRIFFWKNTIASFPKMGRNICLPELKKISFFLPNLNLQRVGSCSTRGTRTRTCRLQETQPIDWLTILSVQGLEC